MFKKKFSRRDFIKGVATFSLGLAAMNFFPSSIQAANPCTVKLRQGIYNGFVNEPGIQTWLGIPYAKPPVGNLRWHAPEKLDASDKEFDAKKFGYSPMQLIDDTEEASFWPQSENCLTLNIWTSGVEDKKPVMIYIPGGGFVGGGSADPLYNGASLATHDVVVVTINYRLNIFGFMNFAAIDSSFEDTGYLGIKDQVAALEWVKENIAAFGGDPDNVMIFGESAGAASVMLLMVLPQAKGLFQKVIAQSGHLAMYHTFNQSAKLTNEFMELGGYKNMQELMTKPAEELRKTYEKLCDKNLYSTEVDYFPTCDGKYLPEHPLKALADGAAKDVKLLTGTNADEYRYWMLYYPDLVENMRPFHASLVLEIYEGEFDEPNSIYQSWEKIHPELDALTSELRYLEFANQIDWRIGQELAAEYQSNFNDVYYYLFSQKSPNKVLDLRSCHAIDLAFIFNNPTSNIEENPDPQLVEEMQTAWISFAKSGTPDNALIPTWKKYTTDDRETMEINSKAWTLYKDLNTLNLNELRGVYEDRLLD